MLVSAGTAIVATRLALSVSCCSEMYLFVVLGIVIDSIAPTFQTSCHPIFTHVNLRSSPFQFKCRQRISRPDAVSSAGLLVTIEDGLQADE